MRKCEVKSRAVNAKEKLNDDRGQWRYIMSTLNVLWKKKARSTDEMRSLCADARVI